MSRATISTGGIEMGQQARRDDAPGLLLVLGDFSGCGSRGEDATPRLVKVDRDSIDEVFAKLNVRLRLPLCEQSLCFSELDELNPDFLYENVDLFEQLRSLRRRLKNPQTFAAAAAELTGQESRPQQTAAVSLDDLLGSTGAPSGFDVRNLIQDIVAPYVIPAQTPQQGALLDSVDQASAELMRKLMHQSAFRKLESAWLGLQWLLRRLDDDPRLYLIDCRPQQLPALLAEHGALEGLLERAHLGEEAPALVIADFQLGASNGDCVSATALAEFAQRNDTLTLAGGDLSLAGCDARSAIEPTSWQPMGGDIAETWHAFRNSAPAEDLALIAPRFLLRLPYGKRGASTEVFQFEEVESSNDNAVESLLWGSGAWLAALAACNESPEIDDLPLYLPTDEDTAPTCIEVLLNDRAASALKQAGLLPLRGVANSASVRLPEWISCSAQQS